MIRTLSLLSLLLFSQGIYAQLDSLHHEFLLVEDSIKAEVLLAISTDYNGKNTDSVFHYAIKAKRYAEKYNDEKTIGRAFTNLGTSMLYYREYDSALYYYKKGLEISKRVKDEHGLTRNLTNIGIIYYYRGDYRNALHNYIEAAKIGEQISANKILASIYDNMGIIYQRIDDLDKAKKTYLKSYDMAVKAGVVNSSLTNLSTLYIKLGAYDSALISIELAHELYKKHGLKIKEANALGMKGYIFMKMEQYDRSLTYFESAQFLFKQLKTPELAAEQYIYSALALEKLNRNQEALKNLDEALNQSSSPLIMKDVEDNRSIIYEKMGLIDKSLASYKKFIAIRDSIGNVEKYKQVTELEAKYETEKKSREIDQLNNEANIQQLKIQQQYWLISGAVLFFSILVLLIILFYRQRGLKKENQVLGLEQRFLRFQMNPHFIFNSLGAIQKFTLTNNPIESASFISKFSSLIRQVLEHSREEYITLEKEIASLENYLDLQKLRFEDSFDYAIEVDDTIDQELTEIPPMFAQPFIENALEHGISALGKRGEIMVRFDKAEKNIRLTITDNGKGLENLTPQSQDHISLATTITEERIEKFGALGKDVNLTIENIEDNVGNISGVRVSLLLPTK